MNACRIVYVIDEQGSSERYGFAYGTLPDHMERGEERFTVEFDTDDQTVWYDLYAFCTSDDAGAFGLSFRKSFAETVC